MSTNTLKSIADLVRTLDSMDDLRAVSELLNAQREFISSQAKYSFRAGDKVQWTSKIGQTLTGRITKIGPKNIVIETSANGTWRVSPTLLSKAA